MTARTGATTDHLSEVAVSVSEPVSLRIRRRLERKGVSFGASDAIGEHLEPGELEALEREVETGVDAVLNSLVIDTANDPNSKGTAARVAKMYLREVFAGRYRNAPSVTDFPNERRLGELYTVGPISVKSACSHHMCPVFGSVWIGVVPGQRLVGLSKFSRITRHVMQRPQIQEGATVQLADAIESAINPRGLAIIMRASHTCMTWRGVHEHGTTMTTRVMRGVFITDADLRNQFTVLGAQEFTCR